VRTRAASLHGKIHREEPAVARGTRPYPAGRSRALAVEHRGVNDRARRIEHRLEWPLLIAALLTIPAIAIEQSDVGPTWDTIDSILNWTSWLAFVAEIVIMLSVVPDRRRWLREHPLEIAIVILTPPFLPASLQAARAFRLLRLLKLLRLTKLARGLFSTEGVRDASVLAVMTILAGGASYAAVEKDQHLNAWDGVWWAINTVTTVGYGGEPATSAGKVIAIVIMIGGIGFVAILTAAAAGRFLRDHDADASALAAVEQRLDEVLRRLDAIEPRRDGG
jgi:voltage-gated potassium channel